LALLVPPMEHLSSSKSLSAATEVFFRSIFLGKPSLSSFPRLTHGFSEKKFHLQNGKIILFIQVGRVTFQHDEYIYKNKIDLELTSIKSVD